MCFFIVNLCADKKIHFTLRKLCFQFLSNLMGYDRDDGFPLDFEPNGILFGSKSVVVPSLLSCPIQCEGSSKCSFLIVAFLPESHSKSLLE